MDKLFSSKRNQVSSAPIEIPGYVSPEHRKVLEDLQARKVALLKKIALQEEEIARKAELDKQVKFAEKEKTRREQLERKARKVNQYKTILSGLKSIVLGKKARVFGAAAVLSTATIALGVNKAGSAHGKFDTKETYIDSTENGQDSTQELFQGVKEKIDTNFFKELSDSAQLRYLSFIAKDIKDKELADKRHNGINVDSFDNEYDPKVANESDLYSLTARELESGGRYDISSPTSAALGAYQVIPSYHFQSIGLDPKNHLDIKYFLKHPEKQEEAWDTMYNKGMEVFGGNPAKFWGSYCHGTDGARVAGSPEGDELKDANGTSVNDYVYGNPEKKMPGAIKVLNGLKNKVKDGGRWLVDKDNQVRYWVDLNYKKTYEHDIPEIPHGCRDEQYIKPMGDEKLQKDVKKIAEKLRKTLSTASYAEEKAKIQKRTIEPVSSESYYDEPADTAIVDSLPPPSPKKLADTRSAYERLYGTGSTSKSYQDSLKSAYRGIKKISQFFKRKKKGDFESGDNS